MQENLNLQNGDGVSQDIEQKDAEKITETLQSGPVTVSEKAYRVEREARIFTAEDLNEIAKDPDIKKIIIAEGVKTTDFAQSRADILGISLILE